MDLGKHEYKEKKMEHLLYNIILTHSSIVNFAKHLARNDDI